MEKKQDEQFMRLAIEQAQKGDRQPGAGEVGAVLVKDGVVVCTAFNEGEMRHDPTAHAETVLIRRAWGQWNAARTPGMHALLHTAALRNVHYGVPLGRNQPRRIRSQSERYERCLL